MDLIHILRRLSAAALPILLLAACGGAENVPPALPGLDTEAAVVTAASDTHSGNGDGLAYWELAFPEDAPVPRENPWRPLPLSGNLTILAYGISNGAFSNGPYLTGEDGNCLLPTVEHGYYYFEDRHSESTDPHSDHGLLDRASFNLTLALYDTDSHTLCCCEFDT